MSLSDAITYSTVLLECEYNNRTYGFGTGFIINLCYNSKENKAVPVVITNKHVVKNACKCKFGFCKADNQRRPVDTQNFTVSMEYINWIPQPDQSVDLCCFPLAPVIQMVNAKKSFISH